MTLAPERDGTASFVRQLAREREDYALPPRLRELAERSIHRALELLFPHFAAEVGGRAGAVADELAALRALLDEALRLPEAHCADPGFPDMQTGTAAVTPRTLRRTPPFPRLKRTSPSSGMGRSLGTMRRSGPGAAADCRF